MSILHHLPSFRGLEHTTETLLQKRDLSAVIYVYLDTNPRSLTFSSALAVAIEGVMLGCLVLQTTKYLGAFWRSDPIWAIGGIVLGVMVCLGQFGLNLWQTHRMIDKAANTLTEIVVADVKANMGVLVVIGWMNAITAGYFGRRAWNMAGKKTWLACPLILGILSSLGLSLGVAIKGFMLPSLAGNPSAELIMKYKDWLDVDNRLVVVWTAISLVKDVFVCALMTVMLLKSKDEIRQRDRTLFKLLLRLTYETMFGPVAINIINLAVVVEQGATFAGYSRIVTWVLGPIYFSSLLQSLNYRKDVQDILHVTPPRRQSRGMSSILNKGVRTSSSPRPIPLPSLDLHKARSTDSHSEHGYGCMEDGNGYIKELHYAMTPGSPLSHTTAAELDLDTEGEVRSNSSMSIVLGEKHKQNYRA
nr:uncharacterized protein CI109_003770 [Kwoniella shandongensis]KAA5527799.1 hypothetical protein CI109_003770 [Kwoniella shandongensis]